MTTHIFTSDLLSENPDKWARTLSDRIELLIQTMDQRIEELKKQQFALPDKYDFAGIPRILDDSQSRQQLINSAITDTFLTIF